ncbi:MAG: hypothetical protein AAF653_21790, partial [Chloroflexota bacterium]
TFTVIALTIAVVIAAYSWRRLPVLSVIMVGWAVLSLLMARIPFFQNAEDPSGDAIGFIAFNVASLLPIICLFVASRRSAAFKQFLAETPTWVLTVTQLYRISGASLLVYYSQGLLPAEIGVSNAVQDIFIGVTALPVAWALYRGFSWSRNLAIIWNIVGLFDFVSAAAVLSLSNMGAIELSPAPTLMGMYPLSLITLYQVAIAIFIHIYLLQRLFGNPTGTTVQANPQAS